MQVQGGVLCVARVRNSDFIRGMYRQVEPHPGVEKKGEGWLASCQDMAGSNAASVACTYFLTCCSLSVRDLLWLMPACCNSRMHLHLLSCSPMHQQSPVLGGHGG